MRKRILWVILCGIVISSCNSSKIKNQCEDYLIDKSKISGILIAYPQDNTLFPIDFQRPTFEWKDSLTNNSKWYACISDSAGNVLLDEFVESNNWKPDSAQWEKIKKENLSHSLKFAVIGFNDNNENITGNKLQFKISPDSVGAEIFFRAVTLPFSYAVRNVNSIEWYMGNVSGGAPRKMLDNMPVCANCHTFSKNGPTLAMDVDYGNDKGSYTIEKAVDTCLLSPENIISWTNFKKEENDPTFGLLSQISPSGEYVLSTVKDLSIFVAIDDNLAYSQLFFPVKGIIGIYNRTTKQFSELQGANDAKFVQSNPVWSPDNKKVLFARTNSYINERIRKSGRALLYAKDVKEFTQGNKPFKFDIYSVDFNNGNGGQSSPLEGASANGKSNYFPKFSPDGKWVVYCQSDNFMLLQPDSKLYIMEAKGGTPRLMNCNMKNMNSWHSWSPNGHWLVFSSKEHSLYTRLYLTHIDENGNDSPPVLIENLVFDKRAANIPEFYPGDAKKFVKIKDNFSNTAGYYTQLAMDNIGSEYYLRASQNLERAINLDAEYLDAYIQRILLNALLKQVNSKSDLADKKKAAEIIQKLIEKNGEDKALQILKAMILSANSNNKEAEEILKKLIIKEPNYYKAYELLANVYKKENKTELIIPLYNKMSSLVPANDLQVKLSLAKAYISTNQNSQALTLLNSLKNKLPDNEEIRSLLCKTYVNMKNLSAATKEIDFLLAADPADYQYLFMRAEISQLSGSTYEANAYKQKGEMQLLKKLEANKENIPLAFEQAAMLTQEKKYTSAIDVYNSILNALPSNYQALKEKARVMLITQQWHEAVKLYQQLLKIYAPEEEFYNNKAIAQINMGNLKEALLEFNNVLNINPTNIDALYNRQNYLRCLENLRKQLKT